MWTDKGEIDWKSCSLLGVSQSRVKCSLLDGNSIHFTEIDFHVQKKKDFQHSHFLLLCLGAYSLTSKRSEQVCALPTVGKAGKTKGGDSPTPIFSFPARAKRENSSAEINPIRKVRSRNKNRVKIKRKEWKTII